jgi:hypothetical protein
MKYYAICSANKRQIHQNHHSLLTYSAICIENSFPKTITEPPFCRSLNQGSNGAISRQMREWHAMKMNVLWKTVEGPHITKQSFKSFFFCYHKLANREIQRSETSIFTHEKSVRYFSSHCSHEIWKSTKQCLAFAVCASCKSNFEMKISMDPV